MQIDCFDNIFILYNYKYKYRQTACLLIRVQTMLHSRQIVASCVQLNRHAWASLELTVVFLQT